MIEDLKKYIKDNKNIKKHFYNGMKEGTLEAKYQYLKNHFKYDTMNSWNKEQSIGNNVKIYNLGISQKQIDTFFEYYELLDDFWYITNKIIEGFVEIANIEVYFNGRSDGYIVTCPKDHNKSIIDDDIYYYNNYKEYKKNTYSEAYNIEYCYYLVKAFDLLCDNIRSELIYYLDNAEIVEEEITYTQKNKTFRSYIKIKGGIKNGRNFNGKFWWRY